MLGALLFSLGVGTSVTATYAWYTLREFSSVNNLNLQIDAMSEDAYLKLYLDKDGEQIHKEDGYTKEDLGIKDEDGNERELTDVSGMYQEKWLNEETDMQNAIPELRTSYRTAFGVNTKDSGPANRSKTGKDFYVQNVFYLEAGMDCHIYLAEDSDISANQEQNEIVARTKGKNLDKLNQVAHTVRTSFFTDEGYVVAQPDDNDYETYYGGILDLNKDGTYDNKDNKEILYGEFDGEVPYRSEPKEFTPVEEKDITTFISNHGDGITQVDIEKANEQIKKENAKKIKDVTYINTSSHKEEYDNGTRSMVQDVILNKKATPLCSVHKGEKKRIVVSVYVEGWDRYMTDDIASACFDINISFTALFDI